jgi:hypothetical protein
VEAALLVSLAPNPNENPHMAIRHPTNDDIRQICDSLECQAPHARKVYWQGELLLELEFHDADIRGVLTMLIKELL